MNPDLRRSALAIASLGLIWLADVPAAARVAGRYEEIPFPQSCGIFGDFGMLVCSATVIGPDRAYSAAHCFEQGETRDPVDSTGKPWHLRCGDSGKTYPIALAVSETPKVPGQTLPNSILSDRALILIKGEPFDPQPLPIASRAMLEPFREPGPRDCVVAGWGRDNVNMSGTLNVVRMDRLELNKSDLLEYGFGANETRDGDSGGTVACRLGGQWHLVGVNSATYMTFRRDIGVTAEIPSRLLARFDAEIERRRMEEVNAAAVRRFAPPAFVPSSDTQIAPR